jgi:hypothetical protein
MSMEVKWRLGPKRWDWARSIRCLLTGHEWDANPRGNQRVCYRCWTVVDRLPTDPIPTRPEHEESDRHGEH